MRVKSRLASQREGEARLFEDGAMTAECGLLHNHACELDRYRHINRMQMEKAS